MASGPDGANSLRVSLDGTDVGTIVRTPGEFVAFNFAERYRATKDRPVLSLSFKSEDGGLRKDPRPEAVRLPPFFSNLLPEDKLRDAMERFHVKTVRPGNDFDLLSALGTDLPGAVRVIPEGHTAADDERKADSKAPRFSLAGVQMKLSVFKNSGKEGGLTLAVGNDDGHYIAKFPSVKHIGLSENEFAILALSEAIGMEVPKRELVEKNEFKGVPEEFNVLSTGKVLLVQRFDRGADAKRIHMEDFAQVFGRYPSQKYDGAGYHDIGRALTMVFYEDAIEFVRRLALSALVGNGDMHLKNWSLIYRDPRKPELAPVYDVLSTTAYFPKDSLALSLGGEKSFKALTPDRWRNFANRAKLPEGDVKRAIAETVAAAHDKWWKLPERDVVPKPVLEKIDEHVEMMQLVLDPTPAANRSA